MMIDRIGSTGPIQPNNKPGRVSQDNRMSRADVIDISPEAREKSELYQLMDMAVSAAASVSEVRADRVEEVRQKMNDPSYMTGRVISETADRIIDALWG